MTEPTRPTTAPARRLSDRALVWIALLTVVALLISVVIALVTLYVPALPAIPVPTAAKV